MKTPESLAEELAVLLAQQTHKRFLDDFTTGELSGESPIEQMMAAAFLYLLRAREEFGDMGGDDHLFTGLMYKEFPKFSPFDKEHGDHNFRIVPQWRIAPYTVDFLVIFEGIAAVVECDGHDFHERTKEQAEHDRKRDRALQTEGYLVFRFTGREIYRNAVDCASDVLAALHDKWYQRAAA